MAGAAFRERLLQREPLLGTFIKTPTTHTTEIVVGAGLDFAIVDLERSVVREFLRYRE
jgi:staphyloferrin B biosynthesis citrate synthase